MSGRSFARRSITALAVLAAAGCSRTPAKPEADPATLTALAKQLVANVPAPAAARECTTADLIGVPSLTYRTLLTLAGLPIADGPERAAWINPPELDHPAARTLVDANATETAKRQAAAQLLAARSFAVFRVEMVNAPLALGIKELKRGTLGMRVIGYDPRGQVTCVTAFTIMNDEAKSDAAIEASDRAVIDPKVAQAMRDDLRDQLIKWVAAKSAPPPAS